VPLRSPKDSHSETQDAARFRRRECAHILGRETQQKVFSVGKVFRAVLFEFSVQRGFADAQ
jgi:hypothetical protein